MCSAVGAAAGLSIASGALGVYGGYQQAKQYRSQAEIYNKQAGIYDLQAAQYGRQAAFAGAMGRYQGALERQRATRALTQAEANQAEAVKARQQLVGAGKVAFAANGVMLEGREGAATAMWEQDEAADLAYEQAQIKRNADNEVYGYLANAKMAEAQGAAQAQAYRMQGIASGINADATRMQAGMARAQARNAIIAGWGSLLGASNQGLGTAATLMA